MIILRPIILKSVHFSLSSIRLAVDTESLSGLHPRSRPIRAITNQSKSQAPSLKMHPQRALGHIP